MRFQVMADKDPQGKRSRLIDERATRASAEKRKRELVAAGWQGVTVWDTRDNHLSNLLRF